MRHLTGLLLVALVATPLCSPRILFQESLPLAPITSLEGSVVRLGDDNSFIVARGRVAPGARILDSPLNESLSLEECSVRCDETPTCEVFWYCSSQTDPCVTSVGTLEAGRCELIAQPIASPGSMAPVQFTDSIEPVDFISGAPIDKDLVSLPPIQRYVLLYAQSFYDRLDYDCAGSLSSTPGLCLVQGTPYEVAEKCNQDPNCQAFTFHPSGRSDLGPNIGVLKGGTDAKKVSATLPNLNQQAVIYIKDALLNSKSGDSGLSGAEVAGIAIGSAAGASIITCCVFLAFRWRNARKRKLPGHSRIERVEGNGLSNGNGLKIAALPTSLVTRQSPVQPRGQNRDGSREIANGHMSNNDGAMQMNNLNAGLVESKPSQRAPPSPFNSLNPTVVVPMPAAPLRSFVEHHSASTSSPLHYTLDPRQESLWDSKLFEGSARLSPPTSSGSGHSGGGEMNGARSVLGKDRVLEAIRDGSWEHYNVDFMSIEWLRRSDGSMWQLGSGAFSRVYLVKLGGVHPCAAKVILLQDQRAEEIFLREVKTLFHLRHSNIVQFTGICIHGGHGILLMEYMEGGSLHLKFRKDYTPDPESSGSDRVYDGEFSWYRRGKSVALEVLKALHYLHGLGLMHLDLKSANVLLTADGVAKVADVGFTRVKETLAPSLGLGTFAYAAPELLLGGNVTPGADVYSFGVLLREICTGESPVRGLARDPIVPEECPETVLELMHRCLAEDRDERPTARQLFDAIQSLC